MSLDRIPGEDNLYIGSAFGLRPKLLDSHGITHVVSVLQRTARDVEGDGNSDTIAAGRERIFVDVDDVEDEDLLGHFPRIVRFIDGGLRRADNAAADDATKPGPGVYVHCAMGKSRSAAAVVAFLLWKYPQRFAAGANNNDDGDDDDKAAVARALEVVRSARAIAEPNPGFMQQLALWRRMGCPADDNDAVARHPVYQRWLYQSDVAQSVALGRAPERLWFGDEEAAEKETKETKMDDSVQLRCKKCRRTLASAPFILPHPSADDQTGDQTGKGSSTGGGSCPHFFVEPLSWMRSALEDGALEGRLACPNAACKASLGRFAWQGFQCSCRQWVCPAFSLQRSRVDRVSARERGAAAGARFGIRMPPGSSL